MVNSSCSRKRDRWDSSSDEEEENDRQDDFQVQKGDQIKSQSLQSNISSKKETVSSLDHPPPPVHGNDQDDGPIMESKHTNETSIQNLDNKNNSHELSKNLRIHNPLLHGCRSVYDCYERLARLDEGTYGVVWKARDTATDEIVALKHIKFDDAIMQEGFPIAALREISVLLALSHECIVTVREMVVGEAFDKVFMVMEYMDLDLKEATNSSSSYDSKDEMTIQPFSQSELKHMLYQILSATQHLHERWYLHRDMKTSNILVNKKTGKVALCDFGLARKYQIPLKALTQMVITLWYRPPELLFGETVYGPEVDMWRYVH